MIFDKRYFFASSVKNKILSQMLLLFSFFTSHISAKLVAFFHFIHIIKTGRFKYCLFCLLSILCFVAKNDFRQKIYLHFFCEVQNAVLDVTSFFSLINSRVSSLGCFFSRHMFPQKWLLFSPHMFHQNWLLFFYVTNNN